MNGLSNSLKADSNVIRPFEMVNSSLHFGNSRSKSKDRNRLSQKKIIVTLKEKSFKPYNQPDIKIEV